MHQFSPEFRHLSYFLMVAETLNFRQAAENLFISQPGLSRQIQQLEQSNHVLHQLQRILFPLWYVYNINTYW